MARHSIRLSNGLEHKGCDPLQNGAGWKARCPSHEDQRPSLVVTEGDDGKVLIDCKAGCKTESVVKDLGLTWADLFPPKPGAMPKTRVQGFEAFDRAVNWKAGELGATLGANWKYNADFVVQRFNFPDGGKSFVPLSRVNGRWHLKDPAGKLPLYRVDSLAAASIVFVLEGEKCADLVCDLGLVATTSAIGSKSAKKTDWSPLYGKTVVLIPDNDEPGEKYINELARYCPRSIPRRPSR